MEKICQAEKESTLLREELFRAEDNQNSRADLFQPEEWAMPL
jgi:hypothetical protein